MLSFYGCSMKKKAQSEYEIQQTNERCLQQTPKKQCDAYRIAVENNQL